MSKARIYSWNVNGIRACEKKGFSEWLARSRAKIVAMQEVRATEAQIPEKIAKRRGWSLAISSAKRAGYSGVALMSRAKAENISTSLGSADYDDEGRVQIAHFGKLVLANVYFPNGSGKARDNSRVPYKIAFYKRLYDVLETHRKKKRPVIVMGDFNTAPYPIDLARPKQNRGTSGFFGRRMRGSDPLAQ